MDIKRFPLDFMFELTKEEFQNLRSQFVTLSWGDSRYVPMVFTEQGVAMLSSILKSDRAVHVNIAIMRTFVQLRKLTYNYAELKHKIESIEKKHDKQFRIVFDVIKKLIEPPQKSKNEFGFRNE